MSELCLVSMTASAWSNRFPKGETFFPVGRIGVLVKYPDHTVGVFSSSPKTGEFENKQAIDPIPGRGLFKGFCRETPANKAEFERASALVAAGEVIPSAELKLPQFYVACRAETTDIANLSKLERFAGSSDPDTMLKAWYGSLRRFGAFTMVPLDLVDGEVDPARIFECVEGLVDGDGFAVPQLVYQDQLAKEGLKLKFNRGRKARYTVVRRHVRRLPSKPAQPA